MRHGIGSSFLHRWVVLLCGYLLGVQILSAGTIVFDARARITGYDGVNSGCNSPAVAFKRDGATIATWVLAGILTGAAGTKEAFNPGISLNGNAGSVLTAQIQHLNACPPLVQDVGPEVVVGTWNSGSQNVGEVLITYDVTGANDPAQCFKHNVVNDSDFNRTFSIVTDLGTQGPFAVSAHSATDVTYCPEDGQARTVTIIEHNPDGSTSSVSQFGPEADGWGNAPDGGTPEFTNFGTGVGSSTNAPEGNIGFQDPGSDLAKELTLQAVGNQLNNVLQQGFTRNEAATRGVQNLLGNVNSSLGTINSSIGGVNSSLGGVNTRLDTANTKLASMESKLSDTAANTLGTRNATEASNGKLDTANVKLGSIDTGVAALQAQWVAAQSKFTTMEAKAVIIGDNTTAALSKFNEMDAVLDAQLVKQNSIENQLEEANSGLGAQTTYLQTIVSNTQEIENNTLGTKNAADQINSKASTANTLLQGIKAAVEVAQIDPRPNIDAVKASIDGLQFPDAGASVDAFHQTFKDWRDGDHQPGVVAMAANLTDPLAWANATKAAGDSAASTHVSDAGLTAFKSSLDNISTATVTPGGNAAFLTVSAGGYTFDANIFNVPWAMTLAGAVKTFLTWGSTLLFIFGVWRIGHQYIQGIPSARQADAPDVNLAGFSAGTLAGVGWAYVMAIAMLTVPAALVAFASQYNLLGVLGSNPLSGFAADGGAVGTGLLLAEAFIPFTVILSHVALYFVATFSFGFVYMVASIVIRYMFACVVFWIGAAAVNADEVTLRNWCCDGLQVTNGNYVWHVPLGESRLDLPGADGYGFVDTNTGWYWVDNLPTSEFGAYVIEVWRNVGAGALEADVAASYSLFEWFGAGFGFALVVLGWGLKMRIVKKIGNHSPDI